MPAKRLIALLSGAAVSLAGMATAQGDDTPQQPATADGILPSLSALWFVPQNLRLRSPEAFDVSEEPIIYDRRFPIGGQEAIDRGFLLPSPIGVSILGVNNEQEQIITDLSVALGVGEPPPPGSDLKDIPFVTLSNVVSDTDSVQVKADLWVLPFLNVYGILGSVTGTVNLDVNVNLDEIAPPGLCPPANPCGTATANFDAGVNTNSVTLGATAVYGWENYFTSGSINATASFGDNTDTTIRTWGASGRFGRRWAFAQGNVAAPYIGISYFDLDQTVEGVTRLPDAFPNGESLDVRYKARTQNRDKWSGVIGLNLGFQNGMSFNVEWAASENSDRTVIGGTIRF